MINRYVEVTDEYIKQLEQEIDNLKAINEEHKKINGKLRIKTKIWKCSSRLWNYYVWKRTIK